jgi:uncharacterized membrane protein YsdA (DUF1294 family)
MIIAVIGYAVVVNVAGFIAFAWDKHCARNGMWRVSESMLLSIAAVGGTIGAILAKRVLRHKSTKQPFGTYLISIALTQVTSLIALCFPQVRDQISILFDQALR